MNAIDPQAKRHMDGQNQQGESHETKYVNHAAGGKFIDRCRIRAVAALHNKTIAVAGTQTRQHKNAARQSQENVDTEQQEH